jgi:uncharacterized protein
MAGVHAAAARLEMAIGDAVPARLRDFLPLFDSVAICVRSSEGHLRTSLWLGSAGFIETSADGGVVTVRRDPSRTSADDPAAAACARGGAIGMLAIDFATRRRIRINGTITAVDGRALVVAVRESFVNCPKYIQRRAQGAARRPSSQSAPIRGEALDLERRVRIERADTAFIATTHPARGLDVSHRGGEPGFIRALDERAFSFPDYDGNNMFTTLGNLAVSPLAGFAIVDFDAARILSLTGTARFSTEHAEPASPVEPARACIFSVESWVEFSMLHAPNWLLLERSPFNPPPFAMTPQGRG